ncbi:unnamed protein product [Clonostachys rosea]|uniref:Clr5 domain-containing protein n=1 Tax=Bionectria ochroleuca TaxID=29856 RepID=A0ABY6ULF2_BIOOC|nr:unnamed protein product [Clonostachys rosea]
MESTPEQSVDPHTPSHEDSNNYVVEPAHHSDRAIVTRLLNTEVSSKILEEVVQEAKQKSSSIFANYDTLNAILLRHEGIIQSRWTKKKRAQKLKVLDRAWPGMAKYHRPDLQADVEERVRHWRGKIFNARIEDYKWPYINKEDLLKTRSLILLLNARGRHQPSEFAAADFEAMHLGYTAGKVIPIVVNEHVMILHGVLDREKYGTLLDWKDHKEMCTRSQFLPGEGLLVLEAQERLMEFLVKCCKLIMHDIPAESLTGGDSIIKPEPSIKKSAELDGFESLTAMATERQYRLPAEINFEQIEAVLGAAESAAEDHLWSLRVDPGYLAEKISETKEHCLEVILDDTGRTYPTLQGRQDVFISSVVETIITSATLQLEIFHRLRMQAQTLQSLHNKYESALSPDKDLPDDFLSAILKFRYYLDRSAGGYYDQLGQAFLSSPPARRFFVRSRPGAKLRVRERSDAFDNMTKGEEMVVRLIGSMYKDGYILSKFGLPTTMDELDRLIQRDISANKLISPTVAGVLGDLSIISECCRELDHFLPWARGFKHKLSEQQAEIKAEFDKNTAPLKDVARSLAAVKIMKAATLCNPLDKKLVYPAAGRRNKENTEMMRRAEETIEVFWAWIDEHLQKECSELDRFAFWRMLSQPRHIQKTPEWVDCKTTRAKASQVNNVGPADTIYKPLSNLFFGHQDQGQPSRAGGKGKTKAKAKTKTKTKGQPIENQASAAIDVQAMAPPAPVLPSIPVDARALKVFRTIFYNPALTSTIGEIAWIDFVHAMTSTGLFSAEKRQGSAWQFSRTDGDLRRIHFHAPHPSPKIRFTIARHFGRRLTRAYSWEGKMFVLEKKSKPSGTIGRG